MNDALPGVLSSAGCRLECILPALVDTKKSESVQESVPESFIATSLKHIRPSKTCGTFGAGSFENGQIKCTSTNNIDKCLQHEHTMA